MDPIRLKSSQAAQAGAICALAFHATPVFEAIIPDAPKRLKVLRRIFTFYIRYGVLYGEVYATSPKLEGIAVLLPSDKVNLTVVRMLRCGGIALALSVDRRILWSLSAYDREILEVHNRLANAPHWYIAFIGVAPSFQGNQYGRKLLERVLTRVDSTRLPCYIETHIQSILGILEDYEFVVLERFEIPGIGIQYWAMRRDSKRERI